MQRRERGIAKSLGGELTKAVKQSRVLLVGAGGIGCEVLKNLVCCGFGSGYQDPNAVKGGQAAQKKAEIMVIDLDTIDLSNLNRQFLFRKQHIKQPKAFVAKETASKFNPSVSIDAQHASIFDSQFDVEFYERFDIVFNALDNLAARRHVNRMCLAANVPLIESGTTGFNGQVQAIKKGVSECYDCNEKPVQQSFPICTIRSTPSQPIHCIVWAKSYLLPELFGTSEDESTNVTITDGDNAEEVAKLKEEADALKKIRDLMGKDDFAKAVFNKVFHEDIERLRGMSEMWQSRKAPDSLRFESVVINADPQNHGALIANEDQRVWSLIDNLKVFCHSIGQLSKRLQAGSETTIDFDKDDKDTLDFVTAAANLRAHIFGIALQTEWDIKQMAGNIIPAIATSNALTASLCVLEAFKIRRYQSPIRRHSSTSSRPDAPGTAEPLLGGSKMVFLSSKSTERMITGQHLLPPKATCAVCSPVYAKVHIKPDSSPKLQQLVQLLKDRCGYREFSITVDDKIIYDPDLEDNLEKPLSEFGIDGKRLGFLQVVDDSDEPKVDLVLSVKAKEIDSQDEVLLLPDSITLPLKPKTPQLDMANGDGDAPEEGVDALGSTGTKRKRDLEEETEDTKKKVKSDEVLIVDDGGAIQLD